MHRGTAISFVGLALTVAGLGLLASPVCSGPLPSSACPSVAAVVFVWVGLAAAMAGALVGIRDTRERNRSAARFPLVADMPPDVRNERAERR
jgi:hypothetical protein